METNSSPFDARADMVCYPLSKLKGFLNVDSTTIEMHFEPLLVVADSDDTSVVEDKVALTLVTADTHKATIKEIIKAISKIQSQSTSNPSSISQAAAVEALNGTQDFIQERSNAFKERRDFVVNSLNNIKGISCLKPSGAFYVFPSCKKLLGKKTKLKTDKDFVEKLLEEALVAVVQGSAFGLDGYFRISYATSMDNLKKALERIKSFCESLS